MINSAVPDQLASEGASWSGSALFAMAGYIWDRQNQGESGPALFAMAGHIQDQQDTD